MRTKIREVLGHLGTPSLQVNEELPKEMTRKLRITNKSSAIQE